MTLTEAIKDVDSHKGRKTFVFRTTDTAKQHANCWRNQLVNQNMKKLFGIRKRGNTVTVERWSNESVD